MKISRYIILPLFITVILFIIPFFWLKPGEMDLGGDSGRLFFYDPMSYLKVQILYNVSSSGIGGEAISYFMLPYLLLLAFLKIFIGSPTILISIFNGLKISVAFLSCYLIVKELLKRDKFPSDRHDIIEYSAIFAGLFYIFSPVIINSGWDRAILSHFQIPLNPLMFFLLLKYFVTRRVGYLLATLLLTFIFSFNFSYFAAPAFFAFFPLSALFLFLYTKYIKGSRIPYKGLAIGSVAFIVLQSFHLVPHLINLVSAGSDINQSIFSDETKFSKGLDYFTAIASSIKVSISFLGLAQRHDGNLLSLGFFIFPATIILGFFWNKTKTLLLTGIFLLVVVFFVSANITDIGFYVYKALFYIPGFKMFRNFYGQWAFVYLFFYSLVLGQSLAIILHKFKEREKYLFLLLAIGILFVNAFEFVKGSLINAIHVQTENVKQVIRMDETFEKVIAFVRNLPTDEKILTLPLAGPGYQVVQGKDGGAYLGPSFFSYLAGKNDYTGYEGLKPFSDLFLRAAKDKDYPTLEKLFSVLNIRYIFYNSDPYIYGKNFTGFPYDYVKEFLPKEQEAYKIFIKQLPVEEKIDFGEKFHFYSISENVFLPRIFTTTKTLYTSDPLNFQFVAGLNNQDRPAVFYFKDSHNDNDPLMLETQTSSPLSLLQNNYHLHRHEPFISLKLDDFIYPLSLWRENFERWKRKKNHNQYIDFSLLYLSKRIFEVARWSDKLPILKHELKWEEPKIWEFYKIYKYNSWEASIARYKEGMMQLIDWIGSTNESPSWKEASKIKINEQLLQHQLRLMRIIKSSAKSDEEKQYLSLLAGDTFKNLFSRLNLALYDPSLLQYDLVIPESKSGEYEVYIEKKDYLVEESSQISIDVENKTLRAFKQEESNSLIKLDNVEIQNAKKERTLNVTMHLPPVNLLRNSLWENSGTAHVASGGATLRINNVLGDSSGGLVQEIPGWQPNKQYITTFDYQTFGDDFIFQVYDKRLKDNSKKQTNGNAYLEKNLNAKTWSTHQSIVTADNKSLAGFIQILGNSEKTKSEIYIKNFSVVEMRYPKIFFKKVNQEVVTSASPQIFFTRINPTKYKIQVNGVSGPYTLVFQEQFSKNWKLENIEKNTEGLKPIITRFFAAIEKNIIALFIKDYPIGDTIVKSYSNVNVKEGLNRDIFLAPSTFETLGKDSVADHRHFQVNGYANGWNIKPEDMDGKTNYTLVLEMVSQKQFYPLLFLSTITALSICIYSLHVFFRRNEKHH